MSMNKEDLKEILKEIKKALVEQGKPLIIDLSRWKKTPAGGFTDGRKEPVEDIEKAAASIASWWRTPVAYARTLEAYIELVPKEQAMKFKKHLEFYGVEL